MLGLSFCPGNIRLSHDHVMFEFQTLVGLSAIDSFIIASKLLTSNEEGNQIAFDIAIKWFRNEAIQKYCCQCTH